MMRLITQVLLITTTVLSTVQSEGDNESVLSSILLPSEKSRAVRSYYERYGYSRPYDRDDRPSRCGRCDDDEEDDRDDDRRSNKPTHGRRYDRNRSDDDDDKHYSDRRSNKNETDEHDDKTRDHDEKDKDRNRDRPRNRHRNRYDDRDRYSPDYYDRFLRDPYRDRYDDYPRRPLYDRNPYPDRHNDGYGRYDGYGYSGYRRPYYDDRYDRGYDDGYGGYGPGTGGGLHDSFRPWDETYRGQAGWDAGGRGYYFASGRPDSTVWAHREYARPQTSAGWQNIGYQSNPSYGNTNSYPSGYSGYANQGYQDPYRSSGYGSAYQAGYGQSSGWRNVGERRPYRDESGVTKLDSQDSRYSRATFQPSSYQPASYSQSTTPETSYLHQREDQLVTKTEDSTQHAQ